MAIFKSAEALKFNNDNPCNNLHQIGSKILEVQQRTGMDEGAVGISPLLILVYAITADATGGLTVVTMPFAAEVIDVVVQARASSGSGTVTLRKATSAITDAIVMAVDTTVVRAGTIAAANALLAAGNTLTVITNGSADRGLVTIKMRKI